MQMFLLIFVSQNKKKPAFSFLEAHKRETNGGNETKGGETMGGRGIRCF